MVGVVRVARGVLAAVTVAAMVATPLNPTAGRGRRVLANVVVGGLFGTTLFTTVRRWGVPRGVTAAVGTTSATAAVERIGSATGFPFGRYDYSTALRPRVGGIPLAVPLAWFAMALPARETAHAALGGRSSPATRMLGGAAALTAWDLFLDPQMVREGYWRWARGGIYRNVPLSNYAGWFVTALGVMIMFEEMLPTEEPDRALVAEYAGMAAMETLAFATFFRDRLVAVVGGGAMLPVATSAVGRLVGQRS